MISTWLEQRFTIMLAAMLLTGLMGAGGARADEPIDFPITTPAGEQQHLSDYRGRWVVVNYWATWCPPCRKELPELDLFNEQRKDDAVVLGINFEDISPQELQQFIDDQFLSYPMFHQRPGRSTPFGRLSGLPTTYVLNPEGVPVAVQNGGITADMLNAFIDNYLPDSPEKAPQPVPAATDSEPTSATAK